MQDTKQPVSTGALVGWRRITTEHGCALTLQLAHSSQAFADRDFEEVHLILNDRQIRSLARDLERAADARGIDLHAKAPRWKFWSS